MKLISRFLGRSVLENSHSLDVDEHSEAAIAQARRVQQTLAAMANIEIALEPTGLHLNGSQNQWVPDCDQAREFSSLPQSFAQSYLKLRVRNFLYETFCQSDGQIDAAPSAQPLTQLANDCLAGGLHAGLFEQFLANNCSGGYYDAGWQVLRQESDGAIALQKDGVTMHVEAQQHLPPNQGAVKAGETVPVLLSGTRLETGCCVAIGMSGPVRDATKAVEIYFAASPDTMPRIVKEMTAALSANAQLAPAYTLKVPDNPEGYEGAASAVLRIGESDFKPLLPVIQQSWSKIYQPAANLQPPLFTYPLGEGISLATVIDSRATYWFGSSADWSRTQLVADALVDTWYEQGTNLTSEQKLAAIQDRFAAAGLSWKQPYRRLSAKERAS